MSKSIMEKDAYTSSWLAQIAVVAIVMALSLTWLSFLSQGRPAFTPDGARALHIAQNLADGEGLIIKWADSDGARSAPQPDVTKPPLFPVLIAIIIMLGVTPKLAGMLVTAAAFAIAASLLFLLARRFLSLPAALVVVLIFCMQVTALRWGLRVHEQMLFMALSFGALLLHCYAFLENGTRHWKTNFGAGVVTALALLTSYQGFALLVSGTGLTAWQSLRARSPAALIAFVGGAAIVGALPFARFVHLWLAGYQPGFDSFGHPTWYVILAGIVTGWQSAFLGGIYVWLDDGSAHDWLVILGAYLAVATVAIISWRRRDLRPVVAYIVTYLLLLVLQLGGKGKPDYETRYNLPIDSLLVILSAYSFMQWAQNLPRLRRRAAIAASLVFAALVLGAQWARYPELLRGNGELCAAPASIEWITARVQPGSVILGTQCALQLLAESNDYFLLPVPPTGDPHASVRWTEEELVTAARRAGGRWLVVMKGKYGDPLLPKPGYGPYVDGLFEGQESSKVRLVVELSDGLIYRVGADATE